MSGALGRRSTGHSVSGPAGIEPVELHHWSIGAISSLVLRILGVASWMALEVWRSPGQVVWENTRAKDSEMME